MEKKISYYLCHLYVFIGLVKMVATVKWNCRNSQES